MLLNINCFIFLGIRFILRSKKRGKNVKKDLIVTVKSAGTLSIDLLTPLQEDLKELPLENYEKLKLDMVTNGISFAFSVWEDKSDGLIYIIDGHQRRISLLRMKKEGYKIPQVPINWVEAEDINHAIRKVLSAASQYGVVTEVGLNHLIGKIDIPAEYFKSHYEFPGLDMSKFIEDNFSLDIENGDVAKLTASFEYNKDKKNTVKDDASGEKLENQVRLVQLFFNGETHPEFLQKSVKLQQVYQTINLTDTILEAVRAAYKLIK